MAKVKLWAGEVDRDLLPPVCAVCGDHADTTKSVRFNWTPSWVIVFIFFGLLPLLILHMIMRRSMTVRMPVCFDHQGHWFRRKTAPGLALLGTLVGGIVFGIMTANLLPNSDAAGIVFGLTAVTFLIVVVVAGVLQRGCIRPAEITERTITLLSVSKVFVNALEDERDRYEEEQIKMGRRPYRPRPEED